MSLTYVLLSPTFGMHQYTADLANRTVRGDGAEGPAGGQAVRVVTTASAPQDRYRPEVVLRMPVRTKGTGFSGEGLDVNVYRRAQAEIVQNASDCRDSRAAVVHFTGVHLWNVGLVCGLRRRGVRVIHTLHDLAPHSGVHRGALIRLWNRLIIASGAEILVHGQCYRKQLLAEGVPGARVTYAPLLHGFWSAEAEARLQAGELHPARFEHKSDPLVIFFGRLEWYKGIDTLLTAWTRLGQVEGGRPGPEAPRLILAGRLADGLTLPALPPRVELRDRRIDDDEALELFRRASLLVLPYRDATQTALIAAAARLGVPSLVTRTGALPEYVSEGLTGWVIPPEDPGALAAALYRALCDLTCLCQVGQAARAWYEKARQEEAATLAGLYGVPAQQ